MARPRGTDIWYIVGTPITSAKDVEDGSQRFIRRYVRHRDGTVSWTITPDSDKARCWTERGAAQRAADDFGGVVIETQRLPM